MGTEILRPQDILIERLRVTPAVFPRRKYVYGNPKPNRKPALRTTDKQDRNRRFTGQAEPSISKRSSSDDLKSTRSNNIVMGQVTILRRGESLDSKIKSEVLQKDGDDLMVLGTQRLGPRPGNGTEADPGQGFEDFSLSGGRTARRVICWIGVFSLPLAEFSPTTFIFEEEATNRRRRLCHA